MIINMINFNMIYFKIFKISSDIKKKKVNISWLYIDTYGLHSKIIFRFLNLTIFLFFYFYLSLKRINTTHYTESTSIL